MLKNYFNIALRNIFRNKVRSFIHILGLSIGIASCFLIFNVVVHSYSFDRFHPDVERIYRVSTMTDWGDGGAFPNSGTPGPLGGVIQDEIPGIAQKGRLYTGYQTLVSDPVKKRIFGRTNAVTFADPGFFQIFPRVWLAGNPTSALEQPNSVVISEASMLKYFPGSAADDVLGLEMAYMESDTIQAKITGVIADYTENSDFIFQDFISLSTIQTEERKEWYGLHAWNSVNSSSQLFVKTDPGITAKSLEPGLKALAEKNFDKEEESETSFFAEPVTEMHFSQNYANDHISKVFLKGLIFIGLIILVLASLNFINLETAQAMNRAKEVGIRKTIGGSRGQLISQFLTETFLIVLISTMLALTLVGGLRMLFDSYLPQGFELDYLTPSNHLFYLGFPVLLTLLTGIYPSMILSGYQAQSALKGDFGKVGGFSFGIFLRKNLTILQFSSSIAFIILVLALNSQLKFVTSQPLGFDQEAVLYASLPFMSDPHKMMQLQNRLNQESMVADASLSGSSVSSFGIWTSDAYVPVDTTEKQIFIQVMNVDSAFTKVNGIPVLAGTSAIKNDDELIVNENFLKEAGISSKEEAIGLQIGHSGKEFKIIGVIGNFNSRTLREEIKPMLMKREPTYFRTVSVKLASDQNLAEAKQNLESIYQSIYPNEEASFSFLDAQIEKFYFEDLRIRNVLGFASVLAILISCMGLFGLSAFTIAQRTKEISIRKVLGASLQQIMFLISKEYLILVGISFLLAVYPAYYFLRDWLNGFNTRIEMPFLIFVVAGLGVMAICLIIVGTHSYLASQRNPAKVLKSE